MVTAQKIQKFGDILTESLDPEDEKSNIDMLNIDYDSSQDIYNLYAEDERQGEGTELERTATSIAGRKIVPSIAIAVMEELSFFAAFAIATLIRLSF